MRTGHPNRRTFSLIFVLGALLPGLVPMASAQDRWVATWAASPQAPRAGGPPRPGTQGPGPANQLPPGFNNQTVRMVVRTSIGGRRARVQLSNAFGATPLKVGAAHVGLHDKESAIIPASDRALTFSGKASFT